MSRAVRIVYRMDDIPRSLYVVTGSKGIEYRKWRISRRDKKYLSQVILGWFDELHDDVNKRQFLHKGKKP